MITVWVIGVGNGWKGTRVAAGSYCNDLGVKGWRPEDWWCQRGCRMWWTLVSSSTSLHPCNAPAAVYLDYQQLRAQCPIFSVHLLQNKIISSAHHPRTQAGAKELQADPFDSGWMQSCITMYTPEFPWLQADAEPQLGPQPSSCTVVSSPQSFFL